MLRMAHVDSKHMDAIRFIRFVYLSFRELPLSTQSIIILILLPSVFFNNSLLLNNPFITME